MSQTLRSATVATLLAALSLCALPGPVLAASRGRLEGLVLGVDGRPAAGHRVHLIDGAGHSAGRSETGDDGLYSFDGLAPGDYSLGIESPDGAVAAVAAPPVRLRDRELARRDLKLVEADPAAVDQAVAANRSFSLWWHGLSKPGKAWTIIAVLFAAGLTYEALDSEGSGSPFDPGG